MMEKQIARKPVHKKSKFAKQDPLDDSFPTFRSTHYRGTIDGDIKKYMQEMHENGAVCVSFVGYEPFKQLWDLGVVYPEVASIRLYFSEGSDQHYYVIDENHVEGVSLTAHSGHNGIFNIKEFLANTKASYWEIDGLDPRAYQG